MLDDINYGLIIFGILILFVIIINIINYIYSFKKGKINITKNNITNEIFDESISDELIAVISAAVEMQLAKEVITPLFRVKSIKKIIRR